MPTTIDSTTTQFITVDDVLRQTNVPAGSASSADLAEIDLYREAAQDVVEGIVGPVLWRTVTETLPVSGPSRTMVGSNFLATGEVTLTYRPVVSVTSITAAGSPGSLTYTLGDPSNGVLTGVGPWPWVSWHYVTVTYVAGRSSLPAAIKLAATIIAAHLYQTQQGNAPAIGGAFDTEQRLDVAEFMQGYSIPPRAVELLVPWRTSTILVG